MIELALLLIDWIAFSASAVRRTDEQEAGLQMTADNNRISLSARENTEIDVGLTF